MELCATLFKRRADGCDILPDVDQLARTSPCCGANGPPWHQIIKASYGNAGGWMHMMCCMKGYLEHGINLRAGGAL
jgi:hypothetical protein